MITVKLNTLILMVRIFPVLSWCWLYWIDITIKSALTVHFVNSLELPFLARPTCFHLTNGGFTFRLSRPQWVRCTLLGLEGSSKFMATLQRAHEDRRWSGQCLRLNPNLVSRRSCSSVGIQTCIKYSHRIDFRSIASVHGRTLVWWCTSSLPKYLVN